MDHIPQFIYLPSLIVWSFLQLLALCLWRGSWRFAATLPAAIAVVGFSYAGFILKSKFAGLWFITIAPLNFCLMLLLWGCFLFARMWEYCRSPGDSPKN